MIVKEWIRLHAYKEFATALADQSKCTERKVAAIILNRNLDQILSIGINGGAKGQEDCMCITDGKYGCLHAEINALIKCKSDEPDKIMIVTLAPCKQCAAAIINAPGGFSKVFYIEKWKDNSGINLLKNAEVETLLL